MERVIKVIISFGLLIPFVMAENITWEYNANLSKANPQEFIKSNQDGMSSQSNGADDNCFKWLFTTFLVNRLLYPTMGAKFYYADSRRNGSNTSLDKLCLKINMTVNGEDMPDFDYDALTLKTGYIESEGIKSDAYFEGNSFSDITGGFVGDAPSTGRFFAEHANPFWSDCESSVLIIGFDHYSGPGVSWVLFSTKPSLEDEAKNKVLKKVAGFGFDLKNIVIPDYSKCPV